MQEYQNLHAEQIILGTIILNNEHLRLVADLLEVKHFALEAHGEIYKYILESICEIRADKITLTDFFKNNEEIKEVGGIEYLGVLASQASMIVSIRDYAKKVVELWQKREMQNLLADSIEDLKTNSFDKVKANLENQSRDFVKFSEEKKTQSLEEIWAEIEEERKQNLGEKTISSGYQNFDKILNGGFKSKQLVIIGARPSVGKTAIAQNFLINAATQGKNCLFISLEVDRKNVIYKIISNLASVKAFKIQNNWLNNQGEYEAVERAKRQLKELKIRINDSSNQKASDIENEIRNEIEKSPVDLVVVDYVQYIRYGDAKGKNEAFLIKENTTALKTFAKKYDVAVVALAQINRQGVQAQDQEPTINDFKGSGGIEEDADVAIILHRDRLQDKEKGYFSNIAKLIVAKNRHGRTGEVVFDFDGDFNRFTEVKF